LNRKVRKENQLRDIRIVGREEVGAVDELVITLDAEPVASVGIAGGVLGLVFGGHELPVANLAVVFGPTVFEELKVLFVLRKISVEGK
jgi:hypothetical protein